MKPDQKIVVGMSGGVDSSVAALLLKKQGFCVTGLFMKNWEETDENGVCTSQSDYEDVRRVCEHIDIPYYAVNFVKEYRTQVFDKFIQDFKNGLTPNPDVLCNREIKFKVFLDKAIELGSDFLATGHYCQNLYLEKENFLVKGLDPLKDQSYFLYTLNRSILQKVLFPIGGMEKKEVRSLARQVGLPTSEKKDSTGICFIGERDFRAFLSQYVSQQRGNFKTLDGKIVGEHLGTAFYTLGQRKGLGIGGPGDAWFVVAKDMSRNVVYIEQGADHPALYCDAVIVGELSWVSGEAPPLPLACQSKIRYRQSDQPAIIEKIEGGKAFVTFPHPQRAATHGQAAVFYDGPICLGGGIIEQVFKN